MSLDTTAKPPAPAPIDGLPPELRRWAVAAIFTALALASLDTAIANIALPAIAADLHVSPADVVWVVNIYQIALVATLLPLGALGEIVGHRRVYLGGLLLFTLASLGCAFAWSLPSLTAARALQGLGASGIMSVNAALVRFVYPTHMLGRGFGHNAPVVGTAFTIGPTIASAILAIGTWPWLFAINIPFGVIAIWIGLKTLPKTPRAKHAFDFASAALTASCLGLFIVGIGGAAHQAPPALVGLALGAALLLGWIMTRRDADHPAPMLPIDLFRRPMFALSAATSVCSFAVQGLAFVSLPFYFEDVLHRSQVETGFFMTPWPLVVAIMAPIGAGCPTAIRRHPRRPRSGAARHRHGAAGNAATGPRTANIVWRMVVCGIGSAFSNARICGLMSSAPPHRATARRHRRDRPPDRANPGAALAALCFGLAGHDGATLALALGAGLLRSAA
jgi:DHA2 family multidrug resistance protein-like MFS transporter